MEIQKSFTYQFDDERWVTKLGIGALISLIPIINFAMAGYEVEIIRNVASHAAHPLPDWDQFGRKFRDGLILTLAGLVYSIPGLILLVLLFGLLVATGAGAQAGRFRGVSRPLTAASIVLFIGLTAGLLAYSLLLSILRPVILIIFSQEGTFASCFHVGEIVRVLSQRTGPFFTTWLVVIVAALAIGAIVAFINIVVGWIPCLGWTLGFLLAFGAATYLITVDAYIFGQLRLAAFPE